MFGRLDVVERPLKHGQWARLHGHSPRILPPSKLKATQAELLGAKKAGRTKSVHIVIRICAMRARAHVGFGVPQHLWGELGNSRTIEMPN